ncbi:surfactant protein B [Dictyocaulus viviparus]|uniref:Surfactant protein B n=1 Tax=Dictyocaulus viviparus TaxID=29172 RepID=A0A0D8XN54_DICVI|nr:surfactant protein B [Dictyocaulus viviparus]
MWVSIARHLVRFAVFIVVALEGNGRYEVNKKRPKEGGLLKSTKPDCMKVSDGLGCACPVCKESVQFIRIMILDHVPTTEKVLDKVCRRIFKDDIHKERLCEEIVTAELPDIIKYVKERIDPKKVCTKFC